MRKFLASIVIITLFAGLVPLASAQTLQKEQPVEIRAWVPEVHALRTPPQAPKISDIQVLEKTETSALIFWRSDQPANSYVDYGLTRDYEMGLVFDEILVKEHRMELKGLKPKITYHFKVRSRDLFGTEIVSDDYTFVLPDLTPPANVSNFSAKPGDRMITLTWINPPDEDFVGVKIQMSTTIYPSSPTEGTTVYDGNSQFVEVRPLQNGVRYYFTAFSYDDSANYASGAIASAVPTVEIVPPEVIPFIPPELVPKIAEIVLEDFIFTIEGVEIFPLEGVVEVRPLQSFKISIPVEKLPKVLKTIITVIGEHTSSYLLRINPEETAYEAIITAPQEPGLYPMTTIIMDFKEGTVAKIEAKLKVVAPPEEAIVPPAEIEKPEEPSWIPLIVLVVILLTVGVTIGYLISRKLQKKNVEVGPLQPR